MSGVEGSVTTEVAFDLLVDSSTENLFEEESDQGNEESINDEESIDQAVQRVPASFEIREKILTCTVCGARASADINKVLFCSNAHNHPLMEV